VRRLSRSSRLTLAAVALAVPLTTGTSCSGDEPPIRAENGNGVDGETGPDDDGGPEDGDNGGSESEGDAG
jgi:hypothetical protein